MQIIRREFANGYGVSVIDDGYGARAGLFELAVTHNGKLCYDTTITDNVLGWLTMKKVTELIKQVEMLPKKETS